MVMGGGGDDDDGDDAMDNLITHENTGTYVFNVSVFMHKQLTPSQIAVEVWKHQSCI